MTYTLNTSSSGLSAALDLLLDRKYLLTADESEFIRDLFCDESKLETLELTHLQRSYLGFSGASYNAALSSTPRSAIDHTDRSGRTILSWAARLGDHERVSQLLACGADPNKGDMQGMISLHFAIFSGSLKCIESLIDAKVDLEAKNHFGRAALTYSAMNSAMKESGTITSLLKRGVDLETRDTSGWRPLHLATRADCGRNVLHLLQAGANVNARVTRDGISALHIAIQFNSHEALTAILTASDLDPQVSNAISTSVVGTAAKYGDRQTLQILCSEVLRSANIRSSEEQSADALKIAKWRRDDTDAWLRHPPGTVDTDPTAWFGSFIELTEAIENNQQRSSGGETDVVSSHSDVITEIELSGEFNADGSEDIEVWQDALEVQDSR